ncbi:hypothetical protein Bateq7PJ16_4339 [Bacillus subtilis]|nr:hypothetical protein Bateq7PJ16_4339 [Bacillus subtilis]
MKHVAILLAALLCLLNELLSSLAALIQLLQAVLCIMHE